MKSDICKSLLYTEPFLPGTCYHLTPNLLHISRVLTNAKGSIYACHFQYLDVWHFHVHLATLMLLFWPDRLVLDRVCSDSLEPFFPCCFNEPENKLLISVSCLCNLSCRYLKDRGDRTWIYWENQRLLPASCTLGGLKIMFVSWGHRCIYTFLPSGKGASETIAAFNASWMHLHSALLTWDSNLNCARCMQ